MKWFLLLVALLACQASATGPIESADTWSFIGTGDTVYVVYVTQINPPAQYEQWYREAEACSGRHGDFAGVKWFVTPHPFPGVGGKTTYGLWHNRQILINADQADSAGLIKHEELHDILWESGWRPPNKPDSLMTHADLHPNPPFGLCTDGWS